MIKLNKTNIAIIISIISLILFIYYSNYKSKTTINFATFCTNAKFDTDRISGFYTIELSKTVPGNELLQYYILTYYSDNLKEKRTIKIGDYKEKDLDKYLGKRVMIKGQIKPFKSAKKIECLYSINTINIK